MPFPSLGDLPNPEIEPRSPALQARDSLPSVPPGKPMLSRHLHNQLPIISYISKRVQRKWFLRKHSTGEDVVKSVEMTTEDSEYYMNIDS